MIVYTKFVDKNLIHKNVKMWVKENGDETVSEKKIEKCIDFYYIIHNNICIGWVGLYKSFIFDTLKVLHLLYINANQRNKGYMQDVIKDLKNKKLINALHIGFCENEFNKYKDVYIKCGLPIYTKFVSLQTGCEIAEFFLVDKEQASLPVSTISGDCILITDDEINILQQNNPGGFNINHILDLKIQKCLVS